MPELVSNGKDFLESVGWKLDSARGLTTGGQEDKRRHNRVMEKWTGVKRVGFEIVTVINCLPFPIEIRSTTGYLNIRGCKYKEGEFYFAYQLDRPKIAMCDEGDAKYTPELVYPVEFAMEFERTYGETGGVFFVRGAKDSLDTQKLLERVMEAQAAMTEWMTAQYNLGEDTHARFKGQPRRISDNMRAAAMFLKDQGLIDNLPEWVNITRATAGTKPCPNCSETIKAAAKVCRFCMLRTDVDLDQQLAGPQKTTARPANHTEHEDASLPSLSPQLGDLDNDLETSAMSDRAILDADDEALAGENRGKVVTKEPKQAKDLKKK